MINIHKQLWVVKGVERKVEDSDYLLAYMTHREYTKDEETSSFQKRKETSSSWARKEDRYYDQELKGWKYTYRKEGEELSFDNTPISGFRIVGSVSRWSTSNKLIQVEDPRGFVVEIPTSNLTTLLKHTVVDHGEVKEECVWGKEGNNHILLPINSEVYKQACTQNKQQDERVTFASLKVGQVVKFSVDDSKEYVYLGRGKAVWEVQTRKALERHPNYSTYWWRIEYLRKETDPIVNTSEVKDDKWAFIFSNKEDTEYNWDKLEYKYSGKCAVVGEVSDIPSTEGLEVSLPNRLHEGDYIYPEVYRELYTKILTKRVEMK